MWSIINLLILIGLIYWIIKLYSTSFIYYRTMYIDEKNNVRYLLNKEMYFLLFTICTAPVFLGSLSLVKYGVWFIVAFVLLFKKGYVQLKLDIIVIAYILFYVWLIIRSFDAPDNKEVIALLIKYLIPLLFLFIAYRAFDGMYTLLHFNRKILKSVIILIFLIGGISAVFYPFVYFFLGNIYLVYAGFCDYLTSLIVVPIVLYFMTQRKIYLIATLLFIVSVILESVRTAMGGMLLVACFSSFYKFKLKSIPYILGGVLVFLSVILFVPSVNEKMFGEEKAGQVTVDDVVNNNALSLDNVQTNGRTYLWDKVLTKFYEPNKIIGSGLGSVTGFLKDKKQNPITFLLHNDYVQIMGDTGLVGLLLAILFAMAVLIKVSYHLLFTKTDDLTLYTGIMAVSSLAGVAFSMGLDNVVSHSMTSLINPFIFIGFFLKSCDIKHATHE